MQSRFEALEMRQLMSANVSGTSQDTSLAPLSAGSSTALVSAVASVTAPSYVIGSIPGTYSLSSQSVTFTVKPPTGVAGPVAMRVVTPAYGTPVVSTDGKTFTYSMPAFGDKLTLTFDQSTGQFSYQPDSDDRFDFEVEFSVPSLSTVGLPISQRVTFSPRTITAENDLVSNSTANLPDPESADYISVSVSPGATRRFNAIDGVNTRQVTISGKTVVFKPGHANGLYERFGYQGGLVNRDIESLTIYAERLVIDRELRLPQTNVTIYARELAFTDSVTVGQINTTPLDFGGTRPGQFQNGATGENAGNITLGVSSIVVPAGSTATRFVLNGGTGQAGGLGQEGDDRPPVLDLLERLGPDWGPERRDFIGSRRVSKWQFFFGTFGGWRIVGITPGDPKHYAGVFEESWPQDGGNATAGGRSGDGGNGGTFLLNGVQVTNLSSLVTAGGGNPGAVAPFARGGFGGTPREAKIFEAFADPNVVGREASRVITHTSQDGSGASAESGTGGGAGDLVNNVSTTAWLQPATLRPMVSYVKDAYLAGNIEFAKSASSTILNLLNTITNPPIELANTYAQLRLELETMRGRSHAGLDYFGNPPGWVPGLSFVASLSAYQSEIDSAIRIKYLARLVENAIARGDAVSAAMLKSLGQLDAEVKASADAVDLHQTLLPSLQGQLTTIRGEIANFQQALQQKEIELQRQAEKNLQPPAWKRALSVLGTIAQVIPVAQPALGIVGGAMTTISNFEGDSLSDVINGAKGVVAKFDDWDTQLKKTRDDFSTYTKSLKLPKNATTGDLKGYVTKIGGYAKEWGTSIKGIDDALQPYRAPKDKLEAELAKLKAQDPTFNTLVDRLTALNASKEAFGTELARAMRVIGDSLTKIGADQQAALALNVQLSDTTGKVDREAADQVKEMGRRADERLLRYQYYMAKAYEYEILKPYTGSFKLAALSTRIGEVISNGPDWLDSSTNFTSLKAIYEADLKTIADSIVKEKQDTGARRLKTSGAFNLTVTQLSELNSKGSVTIDLYAAASLAESEDAIRILDLAATTVTSNTPTTVGSARVLLTFEHSGESLIEHDGKMYQFRHLQGDLSKQTRPLLVGATNYDAVTKLITPTQPDPAEVALLKYLVGSNLSNDVLFTQLGARTSVTIKRELVNESVPVNLTRLGLTLQYSYEKAPINNVVLKVQAPGNGITPAIGVKTPAELGTSVRGRGRGDFVRNYPIGTEYTLFAEPTYGRYRFSEWVNASGKPLGTAASLTVLMDQNKTVKPVYVEGATITGRVFFDTNVNGIADTGESGQYGRTVFLDTNKDGVLNANEPSTKTDARGIYTFETLLAGTYRVREVVPSGWKQTLPASNGFYDMTLTTGQAVTGKNFGTAQTTGTISGTKFNDLNDNGVKDAGEPGLSGWTIYLDKNNNNVFDAGDVSKVTDASGNYSFTGLLAGAFTVREVPKTGWRLTTPSGAEYAVNLVLGQVATGKHFGDTQKVRISGTKFNDLNDNGVKDVGEPGLSGWTIYLDKNNNNVFDAGDVSKVTDASGNYYFTGLLPGAFTVREVAKTGWRLTTPSGAEYAVNLASGQVATGKHFGDTQKVRISGSVFNDANKNAVFNTGETKVAGVRVFLDTDNDNILDSGEVSVLTDSSGNYAFTNRAAGTFNVRIVRPAGKTQSFPAASAAQRFTLTAGQVATGKNFGIFSTNLI